MTIRAFEENDLDDIMQIWLDSNIEAHGFIPKEYWKRNFQTVRGILPQAELYVFENNGTKQIDGFLGLSGSHIEGLFVKGAVRSNGIGRQLLDHAKSTKASLSLCVYQKNHRAVRFYQREGFTIRTEGVDECTRQKEYTMTWSNAANG